ncbi:fibrillarin-like rRNA/tRNA 2'-O-methyltransferase [Thermofilum pendens]|uniref:Fibrillarin-like rRNA/tRNA 2'-O-methyltransferase n=1 Tax=Thermofilum pendens (strain DSM 2475 / Hrk 5) TaxID=368408 RepID=A1RX56_THEPD|nr:fibrillarin-like rRNA/tRNA 2'-O-methyltransferase [Thermofilum pendens]ABL77786.1 rRNA 2'-O-methyltransferase fibrillarin [Thermofilum pendens Hrk 5]
MIRPVKVVEHEKFPGIYVVEYEDGTKKLATVNLAPGVKVYDETLIQHGDKELRTWNPYRSKLAGAIHKGITINPIKPGVKVLYLGVASGTTPSHVSDIIGPKGVLFGVEFAPRVMREFIEKVAVHRENVVPLLADARFPTKYAHVVELVDVVYADIAQPFQAKYVADNADMFLKSGGYIMMAIKAMSIDVTATPSETYKREITHLEERGYKVKEVKHLEPYDEAHAFVVAQKP